MKRTRRTTATTTTTAMMYQQRCQREGQDMNEAWYEGMMRKRKRYTAFHTYDVIVSL